MLRARAYTTDSCYVGSPAPVAIRGCVRGGGGYEAGNVPATMQYDRYGRRGYRRRVRRPHESA